MAVTPRRRMRLEALPIVRDLETNRPSRAVERHVHPGGPRMFAHVGHGLLRDPEERRLHLGWQAPIAQRLFEADLQALRTERLDLKADAGGKTVVVEHGGTGIVDHPPRLTDHLPGELERLVELLPAALRTGRIVTGEGLKVLVGGRGALGQAVVDVVGDAATLFFLGHYELPDQAPELLLTLGQLRVESRVLQGACGLVCEADQGLRPHFAKGFGTVGLENTDEPIAYQQWEVQAHQVPPSRVFRPPQSEEPVLPTLQDFPAGGQSLGGEASLAPQPVQPRGTPDAKLPLLVRDTDDRGSEVRDPANHLQQAGADLLPLQAGAQDLACLVEGEQGVQAASQRFFCHFALRHIVGDDAERRAAAVGDSAGADLHVDERAVLAPVPPLTDREAPSIQNALDIAVYALVIVGDDVVERQAAELLGLVTERVVEGGVRLKDVFGVRVYQEDVLGGLLDDVAVQFLALSELLFSLLPLGDVEHEALPVEGMALFVAHSRRLVAQPDHTTVPGAYPVLEGEWGAGLA